jgi:hypothetical protein
MHRLIYTSRFSARFPREREEQNYQINAIVRASIRNNRAVGITGLLLVHRRQALQVLEGPPEAIGALYERIMLDRRHEAAQVIALQDAPQREFSDWSMCALRVNEGDDAIIDRLDAEGAALSELNGEQALALLKGVRDAQLRTVLAAMA